MDESICNATCISDAIFNGNFFPIVYFALSLLFDVWFPLFLGGGTSVAINIEARAISVLLWDSQ